MADAPTPGCLERRLRRYAGALVLAIASAAAACDPAEQPADAVLFDQAIARLRDELDIRDTLRIHPFPLLRGTPGADDAVAGQRFNVHDSTTVAEFVRRSRDGRLRICAVGAAGSCEVPPGAAALILSEPTALGPNEVGIDLVVTDRRAGRVPRHHYLARLKGSGSGWSVIGLERAR